MFLLKQDWACQFGGLLLTAFIGTKLVWNPDWPIQRHDALFLFAVGTQVLSLWAKLENWVSLAKLGSWYLLLTWRL
ncbi:MAG: DUF817 family protein [Pseudomonadota bacterium]